MGSQAAECLFFFFFFLCETEEARDTQVPLLDPIAQFPLWSCPGQYLQLVLTLLVGRVAVDLALSHFAKARGTRSTSAVSTAPPFYGPLLPSSLVPRPS